MLWPALPSATPYFDWTTRPTPGERGPARARHLCTLLIEPESAWVTRDQFMLSLHQRGIGTGVHYRSLHVHRYYQERFRYRPGEFPNAYRIGERTVSLPLSPLLSDDEVERIAQSVRDVLSRK